MRRSWRLGLRAPRATALSRFVGSFCSSLGALMLVTPQGFSRPEYDSLQPHLLVWGWMFLLCGLVLLGTIFFNSRPALRIALHLWPAATLLWLGVGFGATGGWTGAAFYSALSGGAIVASFLQSLEQADRRGRDMLDLVVGLPLLAVGSMMLAAPAHFSAALSPGAHQLLPLLAAPPLVGGGLLAGCWLAGRSLGRWRRWLLLAARMVAAGSLLVYAYFDAFAQRDWAAVVLYWGLAVGLVVLSYRGLKSSPPTKSSLRNRLAFALCAAAVLPAVAVVSWYGQREEAAARMRTLALQQTIAADVANAVSEHVGELYDEAFSVARIPGLLNLSSAEEAELFRGSERSPYVLAYATFNASGQPLARSDSNRPSPIAGSVIFDEVVATRVAVSDFGWSEPLGRRVLRVAAPVTSPSDGLAGIVLLESEQYARDITRLDVGSGGRAYIVDPTGAPVAVSAMSGAPALGGSVDASLIAAASQVDAPSGSLSYKSNGLQWLAGYAEVPATGWRIVAERRESYALADVRAGRELAFVALLVVAALATVAGVIVAGVLSRPLLALTRAVDELSQGAGKAPLPRTQVDEVATLTRRFAALRDRLAARTAERERVQAALLESEARARAIIDTGLGAVFTMTPQGVVTDWNHMAEELFGWPRSEAVGRPIAELIFALPGNASCPWLECPVSAAAVDGTRLHRTEITARHRDGYEVPIELGVATIGSAETRFLSAFAYDLTERKRAAETAARLAAIVESSDDAIIGETLHGVVTSWNRGAELLYGYSAEEMVGQSIARIVPAERLDEIAGVLRRLRKGHPVRRSDSIRVRKDGTYVDVSVVASPVYDELGNVRGAAVLAHDITESKRAKEEISQLAARFRSILQSTGEGIYGIDLTGRCTYINDAAARALGYAVDEALGQNMHQLVHHSHPDGSPYSLDDCPIFRAFQVGEPCTVEDEAMWRRDGTSFPVEYSSHPIVEHGVIVGAVVSFSDITHRKQVERAIRESEASFRLLFQDNPHPMWVYDAQTLDVLEVNAAAMDRYGFSREEFMAMRVVDFIAGEDHRRFMDVAIGLNRPPLLLSGGWRHVRKDGQVMEVEVASHTIDFAARRAVVAVAFDVTDQRRAERQLVALNEELETRVQARTADLARTLDQLRAVSEVSRAITSSLDVDEVLSQIVARAVQLSGGDSGVIREFDPVTQAAPYLASYGLDPAARKGMIALNRHVIVLEEDSLLSRAARSRLPAQMADVDAEIERHPGEETILKRIRSFGIKASLVVPLVRDAELVGMLIVQRKTTGEFPPDTIDLLRTFAEQSAIALQNARMFRQLEQKSRDLEAAGQQKSDFLATMSHELRTPLNSIIGFSEVLIGRGPNDLSEDRRQAFLEYIHASGEHLLGLINDILDLAKVEAGRMELRLERLSLSDLLSGCAAIVGPAAARKQITVATSCSPEDVTIIADPARLKQILYNLLSNAVKFTGEQGHVHVSATVANGQAEIAVRDDGIGINPEDYEAVFQEFRQLDSGLARQTEGTGLGLALVRKLVMLHGGAVTLASVPGEGSCFTVVIPVEGPAASRPFVAPAPADVSVSTMTKPALPAGSRG